MIKYLTLFFIFILTSPAAEKILFIGNSYTAGIRGAVKTVFKDEGYDAEMKFICPGGKNLKFHVTNEKHVKIIKEGNWDKIILQDQSQTPALPGYNKIFHEAVDDFGKLFKSLDKKPQVYFYMTWGRRDGDKKNQNVFPDFNTMQKLLTENYLKGAKKINAGIAPVGNAFKIIHDTDKELFKSLYAKDGSHPGKEGAYMAACVFYSVLSGTDAEKIKSNGNVEAEKAEILRKAAAKAIKNLKN